MRDSRSARTDPAEPAPTMMKSGSPCTARPRFGGTLY